MSARKRKIAVFDIDGTIFRSSLLIELTWELVRLGIFPIIVREEISSSYYRWRRRRGKYEDYISQVVKVFMRRIIGCRNEDLITASRAVIRNQKDEVYVYTRNLIKKLKNENYFLLAISGSPVEVVSFFGRRYGFDVTLGSQLEIKDGYYTGDIISEPVHDKKKALLQVVKENSLSLRNSIGVGDTESDASFLELVENPICFNPNHSLLDIARARGWPVIVERKDVIYEM